jgi:hypothetical protein
MTIHPSSDIRVKILLTSSPPSHTINRAEFAGIDIGLQLGHTPLLTDSACSLRLVQDFMNCSSAYRHHIHRDTLDLIAHSLKTRCKSGIRTHLGKVNAHHHSLGNDLVDALAKQVADGHPPDTTYTTDLHVSTGTCTRPYTLIFQILGEPMPHMYTDHKNDEHLYNTKHTAPLTNYQIRRPPRTRRCGRGGLHPQEKTHVTNQCPIHTQAMINVKITQHSPPLTQPHPTLLHGLSFHQQRTHGR